MKFSLFPGFFLFCFFFAGLLLAEPFRVGAILPLTGANARSGELAKEGLEKALAFEGIGSDKVRLYYEDQGSKARNAVSAFKKLLTTQRVQAVFTLGSPSAMALLPLANQEGIPLLALAATSAFSKEADFGFRIVGSAEEEGKKVVLFLEEYFGIKRVALLYLDNDYGEGTRGAVEKQAAGKIEIVAVEPLQPDILDYRPQLLKLRQARPEALLIISWGAHCGQVVRQARELGLSIPLIGTQATHSDDMIASAGEYAEGFYAVSPATTVRSEYQSLFAANETHASLRMFDGLRVLLSASEQCKKKGSPSDCLRKKLAAVQSFPGVSFSYSFNRFGDLLDRYVLKKVTGKAFSVQSDL